MKKKQFTKLLLIIAVSGISAFLVTYYIAYKKLQQYKPVIAEKISQYTEYDISFKDIKLSLLGIKVAVKLEGLNIADNTNKKSLFLAKELFAEVNLIKSIFNKDLVINRLILNHSTFRLEPENFKKISNEQENIFDHNLNEKFSILDSLNSVIIKNSKINIVVNNDIFNIEDFNVIFAGFGGVGYNVRGDAFIKNIDSNIELSANIAEPSFNFNNLKGTANLNIENIDVTKLKKIFPKISINSGFINDVKIKFIMQGNEGVDVSALGVVKDFYIDKSNSINLLNFDINYASNPQIIKYNLGNLDLNLPSLYRESLFIPKIYGVAEVGLDKFTVNSLSSKDFIIAIPEGNIKSSFDISKDDKNHLIYNFNSDFPGFISTDAISKYYPKSVIPDLAEWLTISLKKGEFYNSKLKLNNNSYSWDIDFKNILMKYDPSWPAVDSFDGSVQIKDNKLTILSKSAKLLKDKVASLNAVMNDVTDDASSLIIDASLDSDFSNALHFLENSPLKDGLFTPISKLSPDGTLKLSLNLDLNFKNSEPKIISKGAIELYKSSMDIKDFSVQAKDIEGTISFIDDDVSAKELKLNIFGNDAIAAVYTKTENTSDYINKYLHVDVSSEVSADTITTNYVKKLKDVLKGNAKYKAKIKIPHSSNKDSDTMTLDILSNLKGIAVELPIPLNKSKDKVIPSSFKFKFNNSNYLNITSNNFVNASIEFNEDKIQRGYINLGKDAKTSLPESGMLFVGGEVDKVDFNSWYEFLNNNDLSKEDNSLNVKTNIFIKTIDLNGIKLDSSWLSFEQGTNKVELDGVTVKGVVDFSNKNLLTLDLEHLYLNLTGNNYNNSSSLQGLGNINFSVKDLLIREKSLGNLSFNFIEDNYGYKFDNIKLVSKFYDLGGICSWDKKENKTTLNLSTKAENVGELLSRVGYGATIKKASGDVKLNMIWYDEIPNFNPDKLNGRIDFKVRNGSLIGVEPGFGKVLGLLSVDSIQRRMRLDFSDVFGKGLAFDKLEGGIKLINNIAVIEEAIIVAPTADIEVSGSSTILDKKLDLDLYVTPKITNSLPIAAAIAAGNPAVGAAFWLFDKAVNSKYSRSVQYKYKVSGTWDQPNIVEVKELKVKQDNENLKKKSAKPDINPVKK